MSKPNIYWNFVRSPAGRRVAAALRACDHEMRVAACAGRGPVRVVAHLLGDLLGTRKVNSLVGRMVRRHLADQFSPYGRVRFRRENGLESSATYRPL